ncbi:hypothetical protein B0H11DRAFT_721085 [Mycena galericulata]|nr:hypothetical protein B0H11DRAFT_721085 [Mycena galericulata]
MEGMTETLQTALGTLHRALDSGGFLGFAKALFWLLTHMSDVMEFDRVKAQIISLTSEATIATFLAAVQAQIIALSFQDNSTRVKITTNALAFAGVLLDVIAAFLALLSSTVLQRHITLIEKQLASIEDASPQQLQQIAALLSLDESRLRIHGFVPPDIRRRLYAKMRQRLETLSKSERQEPVTESWLFQGLEESAELDIRSIPESFKHIQSAAVIGDAAGTAMLNGILCFFASVQCLAISTQPPAVWIVSAVICSYIIILPVSNRILGFVGIRLPSVFDM